MPAHAPRLLARSGSARLTLQIDMGLGDAVWPAPENHSYPTLLDFPAPHLLAYPREAVVAEKLEAMVVLGDRNSRIKDFFDLHYLATRFEYDRATLAEAVRRTFARRGTPIPEQHPIALTRDYWENPSRPTQMRAFVRRSRIAVPENFADECTRVLDAFLWPVLSDLRTNGTRSGLGRQEAPGPDDKRRIDEQHAPPFPRDRRQGGAPSASCSLAASTRSTTTSASTSGSKSSSSS